MVTVPEVTHGERLPDSKSALEGRVPTLEEGVEKPAFRGWGADGVWVRLKVLARRWRPLALDDGVYGVIQRVGRLGARGTRRRPSYPGFL